MQTFKVVVKFYKSGFMRYISHLDFIRLIYRALRRAELPFVLTQGFNSRPKVKFGQALKVGRDGEMETTFFIRNSVEINEFKSKLKEQLVEGISITGIKYEA